MSSRESVVPLFLPLFIPIPGRQPHILVYKTEKVALIRLTLKRAPERNVSIRGNIKRGESKLLKEALNVVVMKALPESFHLEIEIKKESKCFSVSLTASSLLHLIELGSSIYEESFTEQDKEEIVEGILTEKIGLPEGVGLLVSRALLKNTSIMGLPGSESSEMLVSPLRAEPIRTIKIREIPKLDEGTADLVAKLNSHLLVEHYLSIKEKNELRKIMAERGVNAMMHYLYGVSVSRNGVYSLEGRDKLCLYHLEG